MSDVDLLAFGDLVQHLNFFRLGTRRDFFIQMRFGKAFVVIHRQNVIAVAGDGGSGIRLTRRRAHHRQQRVGDELVIAFDDQRFDPGLRAFEDVKRHVKVIFLPLVIGIHRGSHFGVQKPVRLIKRDDRIAVIAYQRLAESSAGGERRGLQSQATFQQILAKVLISFKADSSQAEFVSSPDFVSNDALAGGRVVVRADLDVRIKITLALEIIANVAAAFLE